MKKFKTLSITVLIIVLAFSFTAFAGAGWVQKEDGWHYIQSDGTEVIDSLRATDGKKYYLNYDGVMAVNTIVEAENERYYVGEDGATVKNCWQKIDEGDGEYWYYFGSHETAYKNGFHRINGDLYHFTNFHMDSGWFDDGTDTYYLGGEDEGKAQKGWLSYTSDDDGQDYADGWYYFDSECKMIKGAEKKIDGRYYVFSSEGVMLSGFVVFDNGPEQRLKYYDQQTGSRVEGWLLLEEDFGLEGSGVEREAGWYYLKNGEPVNLWSEQTEIIAAGYGLRKIDGTVYCFDENGKVQTGLVQDKDGNYYYFDAERGKMRTGYVEIEETNGYNIGDDKLFFAKKGSIPDIGKSYTGVDASHVYNEGVLMAAKDSFELVELVNGYTYVVDENGIMRTGGTVKLFNDKKMKIQKRDDGKGYSWVEVK